MPRGHNNKPSTQNNKQNQNKPSDVSFENKLPLSAGQIDPSTGQQFDIVSMTYNVFLQYILAKQRYGEIRMRLNMIVSMRINFDLT